MRVIQSIGTDFASDDSQKLDKLEKIESEIYLYGQDASVEAQLIALAQGDSSPTTPSINEDMTNVSVNYGPYQINFSVFQNTDKEKPIDASLFGNMRLVIMDMENPNAVLELNQYFETKKESLLRFASQATYDACSIFLVMTYADEKRVRARQKAIIDIAEKISQQCPAFAGVFFLNPNNPNDSVNLFRVLAEETLWQQGIIETAPYHVSLPKMIIPPSPLPSLSDFYIYHAIPYEPNALNDPVKVSELKDQMTESVFDFLSRLNHNGDKPKQLSIQALGQQALHIHPSSSLNNRYTFLDYLVDDYQSHHKEQPSTNVFIMGLRWDEGKYRPVAAYNHLNLMDDLTQVDEYKHFRTLSLGDINPNTTIEEVVTKWLKATELQHLLFQPRISNLQSIPFTGMDSSGQSPLPSHTRVAEPINSTAPLVQGNDEANTHKTKLLSLTKNKFKTLFNSSKSQAKNLSMATLTKRKINHRIEDDHFYQLMHYFHEVMNSQYLLFNTKTLDFGHLILERYRSVSSIRQSILTQIESIHGQAESTQLTNFVDALIGELYQSILYTNGQVNNPLFNVLKLTSPRDIYGSFNELGVSMLSKAFETELNSQEQKDAQTPNQFANNQLTSLTDNLRQLTLDIYWMHLAQKAKTIPELKKVLSLSAFIRLPTPIRNNLLRLDTQIEGSLLFTFFYFNAVNFPQINHVQILANSQNESLFHAYWTNHKKQVGMTNFPKYAAYYLLIRPRNVDALFKIKTLIYWIEQWRIDFDIPKMQSVIKRERTEKYGVRRTQHPHNDDYLLAKQRSLFSNEDIIDALTLLFHYHLYPNHPIEASSRYFCSEVVILIMIAAYLDNEVMDFIQSQDLPNAQKPNECRQYAYSLFNRNSNIIHNKIPPGLQLPYQSTGPYILAKSLLEDSDNFDNPGYYVQEPN